MTSKEIVRIACKALDSKKAEDIKVIEISKVSIIADYFIIANGNNAPQVDALVDTVMDELGRNGINTKRVEGLKSYGWVLLDYGDVVIHIFSKEDRLFYDLERIWKDGKVVTIE